MADQGRSTRFRAVFESALRAYESTAGVTLAEHPLAVPSHPIGLTTVVLQGQAHAFCQCRGIDRLIKSISSTVSNLAILSTSASLSDSNDLPFLPVTAIYAGLAILLAAGKGVADSYDPLIDLIESIEHFINRLDIYTRIPPTPATDDIVVKILIELLSILALATRELKQGRPIKSVKKAFGGMEVDAILQRLDRLSQTEARTTAAQTLEVVLGLVQGMRVVMDDGEASVDGVRETLEVLHQVASDINKLQRHKLQQDIRNWLSPPDPWKNYNIALESRHTGTGAWFIKGRTLSEWKASESSSLLWIHGKPGAGKSVFCSTIVEEIEVMQKYGMASLAIFYCDFREDQKKDRRGLLSSVLVQLCRQSDPYAAIVTKFYLEHENGSKHASDETLVRCFKEMVELPRQAPIFLIVDALDECQNMSALPSPREKVLMLLEDLINSPHLNLRICITSRPETDIKVVLEPLSFRSISLHDESGQMADIEDYINSVVKTNRNMRRWKPEHRQRVIEFLIEKADGMFRWVYCQLEYLSKCLPGRIEHALEELPCTLDETYERILRDIDDTNWEYARRLLLCVAAASRPLRVEELSEFLAFDFEAGPIPKFHGDWRVENPLDAVLFTCSALLALLDLRGPNDFSDSHDCQAIQFSHFSVKEYLTSTRFAEKHDTISRRYHISMTPAHTLVARGCLGILLHLENTLARNTLTRFPLAEYAAEHWFEHARFEGVSQNIEEGMKQLFDAGRPHLAVWLWIYDPIQIQRWMRCERAERPLPPRGTPLHYAAFCGLHSAVKSLVTKQSEDVQSLYVDDKSTPLHMASRQGHVKVARILIEYGADVIAQDYYGFTSLHDACAGGHMDVARFLVEHGAQTTAQNKRRSTPLHFSSQSGNVDLVRFLVEHGSDGTAQDEDGETPLHKASYYYGGNVDIASLLIEHGADVTAQTKNGFTPLHYVSSSGNLDLAHLLVGHGADATAQTMDGWTPLHQLSRSHRENVELARFLIQCGADVSAKFKDGSTPLHGALSEGYVNLARFLIEHGADLTAHDEHGRTPLHCASAGGLVDFARLLIDRGADARDQNNNGPTPLHGAALSGNVDLVRFLVDLGADTTAQDNFGQTPLHQASASSNGNVEVARLLVKHGADATAQDNEGRTPLHCVPIGSCVDLARFLVEHGADVSAQDKNGWTPLHYVSTLGETNIDLAEFLVHHGADVIAQDNDGATPLHKASEQGNLVLVRFLIEHGADVTALDKNGSTPLHYASQSPFGNVEVAQFLIEHGVDVKAQDKDGLTPLNQASGKEMVVLTWFLIKNGADTTAKHEDESSAPRQVPLGWNASVNRAYFLVEHSTNNRGQQSTP